MSYSENYLKMMDVSLNLARIGDWTADNYESRKSLIGRFILQTDEYTNELMKLEVSGDMKILLQKFRKAFDSLKKDAITPSNKDEWAERALTWANILQHRATLLR